jgi:hypothetical protein
MFYKPTNSHVQGVVYSHCEALSQNLSHQLFHACHNEAKRLTNSHLLEAITTSATSLCMPDKNICCQVSLTDRGICSQVSLQSGAASVRSALQDRDISSQVSSGKQGHLHQVRSGRQGHCSYVSSSRHAICYHVSSLIQGHLTQVIYSIADRVICSGTLSHFM